MSEGGERDGMESVESMGGVGIRLEACVQQVQQVSGLLKSEDFKYSEALAVLLECESELQGVLGDAAPEELIQEKGSGREFRLLSGLIEAVLTVLENPLDCAIWEKPSTSGKHLVKYQECLVTLLQLMQMLVKGAPLCLIVGDVIEPTSIEIVAPFVIQDVSDIRESLVPRLMLVCGLYSPEVKNLYWDPWSSDELTLESNVLLRIVNNISSGKEEDISGDTLIDNGDFVADNINEILGVLRPILLTRRPKPDDPMFMAEPDERTKVMVRAKGLVWCIIFLKRLILSNKMLDSLLPVVFSVIDSPIPKVRMMGLKSLDHLSECADASWLLPWREVILNVITDAISVAHAGMDATIWHLTFPPAARLVVKVEGGNPRSTGYDVLLVSIFGGVDMVYLESSKKIALMLALQPIVKVMGLIIVKYFALLMPVLCGYACSKDLGAMEVALETLTLVAKHTWPRIPAHTTVLWKVVMKAHTIMCNQDEPVASVQRAVHELCNMLALCDPQGTLRLLHSSKPQTAEERGFFKMLENIVVEHAIQPGCG